MRYIVNLLWLLWHHVIGEHEWAYRPDLVYRDDNGREHMVLECVRCHRLVSIDGMISRMNGSISQPMAERLRHRPRYDASSRGSLMVRTDHSVVRI